MADLNLYTVYSSTELQREPLLEMLLSELDGMVYCCRQDRHWTMDFVSEGCLKLTGYPAKDLLLNSRISYEEITHIDDRKRVRETIDDALKKGISINVEYRIYHADGSVRWVWERGQGVSMDGYPGALHGFIQDITQRHANEEAMVEAEHRYRSIFENAIEGIFQTTTDGYYLNVNPALAAIYGYKTTDELQQALKNISQQLYVDPGRRATFVQLMQSNGGVKNFESQVFRKDGSVIWISENARTVYGPNGRLLYFEGSVEDITERKYYEQRISHQATHDSLTDLPNRLLLLDRLQQLTKSGRRSDGELAVVLLDLDLFKNVNDSLGHAAGDCLIEAIADRLRKSIRDGDTVARIGGDEFVLLLAYPPDNPDQAASTDALSHLVKRILDIVQAPCCVANRNIEVTCSIGVSVYPHDSTDANELLKQADMAMYQAKEAGRNNYKFFTEELNRIITANLKMEQQLRTALSTGGFVLYYQPKMSISSGEIVGAEALIRWPAGDGQLISPAHFIPLAEKTGIIEPLGKWVIEQACAQLQQWADKGFDEVPVSVNLSPRQFNQPDLIETIDTALQAHTFSPSLLELEITESCLAQDETTFLSTLNQLKALGLQIAIDDFGSGYSNLRYLRDMPVDQLKIDQVFARSIETDKRGRDIYRAIVSMAHILNLEVVAEGIETRAEFEFLQTIGCDVIQGYYFSRPLPADDFLDLLKATRPQ
ncbi:bifunctional diguanylate cyclase/phosphodiesterase [Porticoccus hydrocarbonoclasticus]|jgi:diguanylate cyclase (GGDEF)-like protein/PAS domain S-box-containing protein|uniref:bifunctional diguanylate cyclase/phosphodiesterase n=1 Tax=Porticoccus hydrocarbonoclasticus TaxID=1073414 RepID=UPI00055EE8AA|nr:bifunctional diguanylate cyclase/phosphodiesterase [Porticoccus hydrocarbonoclasticus]